MKNLKNIFLIAAVSLIITACGGGGGGDSVTPQVPATPPVVTPPVVTPPVVTPPVVTPPVVTPMVCTAPAVLNQSLNICVYPTGVKVVGANQLPQGCTDVSQQCWKDAVANGTVKFIATPATMIGINNRQIMFAYFRNAVGQWNYLPTYADDAAIANTGISGGSTVEIDWAYGTANGLTIHEKSTGLCYENHWDSILKSWGTSGTVVTCQN